MADGLRGAAPVAFVATTNPTRALAFYENALGLTLVADEQFALVFDLSGAMLRVTRVDALEPQPFTVLGWRVDDIESEARALAGRGVGFERYPGLDQDDLGASLDRLRVDGVDVLHFDRDVRMLWRCRVLLDQIQQRRRVARRAELEDPAEIHVDLEADDVAVEGAALGLTSRADVRVDASDVHRQ